MVQVLKKIIPKWNGKSLKHWVEKDLTELNTYLIETKKILETETQTEIEILIQFLKEISKFQDKNMRKIKNLKRSLRGNEKATKAIEDFFDVLMICGRDCFKRKRHMSTVKNLNEKEFNSKKFYLENEFYETPQPLPSLRYLKAVPSIISKKTQMDAENLSRTFLLENISKMTSAITNLR